MWFVALFTTLLFAQQVTITPPSVAANFPGQTISFSTNSAHPTWTVVGPGTVNTSGLYTAPTPFPTSLSGTTAYVRVTDSVSRSTAVATILIPSQVFTVTPTKAVLTVGQTLQFQTSVTGATWSVDFGTITSNGLYTPLTIDQKNLLPPQYTSNVVNATVRVAYNGQLNTVAVTTIYPQETIDTAFVNNVLTTFTGSSEITEVGTLNAGTIPTSLLTGTLPATSITGLANSATTDTTNATNINSGTLALSHLPTIPATQLSGLAPSATTDTTNATNIATGTLSVNRLPTNIPVTSITGLSGTPFQTDITGTSISILASTHGRGTYPVMRVYASGTQVPLEYLVNGSGDITASNLPSSTYHVVIVSGDNLATSYEADFSSVTSISVPASVHHRGTYPTVSLFSSGAAVVVYPSIDSSGDVTLSSVLSGTYHIKIF
jgi:hypothetical protein